MSTATHTLRLRTFEVLASASLTKGASVVAWQVLLFLCSYIVYLFACDSSSISASARLLRWLRALSRSSGAGVCAARGHGGPSPSSSACSGGSSDGTPSARTRATRPQSPRAGPHLTSPRSVSATHSSPAGASRYRRRRRATPLGPTSSPAGCGRHRRVRRARTRRCRMSARVDREGSGERGGRPRSSWCVHM